MPALRFGGLLASGAACADPTMLKRRRLIFRIVGIVLLALLAAPGAGHPSTVRI